MSPTLATSFDSPTNISVELSSWVRTGIELIEKYPSNGPNLVGGFNEFQEYQSPGVKIKHV